VPELRVLRPSLEDAYLSLIEGQVAVQSQIGNEL